LTLIRAVLWITYAMRIRSYILTPIYWLVGLMLPTSIDVCGGNHVLAPFDRVGMRDADSLSRFACTELLELILLVGGPMSKVERLGRGVGFIATAICLLVLAPPAPSQTGAKIERCWNVRSKRSAGCQRMPY
jgi:hypothetical protein